MKFNLFLLAITSLIFGLTSCTENEDFISQETEVVDDQFNIVLDGRSVASGNGFGFYCYLEDASSVQESVIATNLEDYLEIIADTTLTDITERMEEGEFFFTNLTYAFGTSINYLVIIADIGNGLQRFDAFPSSNVVNLDPNTNGYDQVKFAFEGEAISYETQDTFAYSIDFDSNVILGNGSCK